jgi:hypothetical protein
MLLKDYQEGKTARLWHHKPIVSWWKSGDPTKSYAWVMHMTDINVINTKRLTDEFIQLCLRERDKIYLHVNITGMGMTTIEPNIPSVRETFMKLAELIHGGFPVKQILVMVNPVLSNDNGLRALELLLRVFTEFKVLRLRKVRLTVLAYRYADEGAKQPDYLKSSRKGPQKFMLANNNINKRPTTKTIIKYLTKTESFFKDYYKLLKRYENIITVDKGEEALIGVRELLPFSINNSWKEEDGTLVKIVEYENGSRFKPIVKILSATNPIRCENKCLLCPWKQ